VPIDQYASQGNAILGIRDSGKSYSATYVAEALMGAGVPIIAFDPIGIWRFLRMPGKGTGFPVVVAGGQHCDLPLANRAMAEGLVRAAMRENVSLVVDLYSIDLSKADWRQIVEACVRVLLYENGGHGLRHIFVEEAAEFVPQVVGPDQGRVYAEMEKLARMGGNALLGYTLVNQRAEQINKAVLELCDCLFLHRQKGRRSIEALGKWLDLGFDPANKRLIGEIIASLPRLEQGECWVWPSGAPSATLCKIPAKQSFHPDRRARSGAGPAAAPAVNVSEFVSRMQANLGALMAEQDSKSPGKLRARIVELEAVIARGITPTASVAEIRAAEARGRDEMTHLVLRGHHDVRQGLGELVHDAQILMHKLDQSTARLPQNGNTRREERSPPPPAPEHRPERGRPAGNGQLPRAERLILTALAQYPQGRTRTQAAVLSGYAARGGAYRNALGALRTRGLMTGDRDRLTITPDGVAQLGEFTPLPHGPALLQHWYGQLGKAERKILHALAEAYPESLSLAQIANRSGYGAAGGAFRNALGRLRTLELIHGRRDIKASADLF